MPGQLALKVFERSLHEVGHIAPIELGFDMAGFQPRDVQQVAHQTVQPPGSLLDFFHHRLLKNRAAAGLAQAAGRAGNGCNRRPDFMGNGIEQGLAEAFGLRYQLGLLLGIPQPLPVQHEPNLADE